MRKILGTLLLGLFALIVAVVGALVLAMIAGNETAIWIGGWGFLIFGAPVFVLAAVCLILGSSLRRPPQAPVRHIHSAQARRRSPLAWGLVAVGTVIIAYLVVETVASATVMGPERWLGIAPLMILDVKLPIGLAALVFGLREMRKVAV